MTPSITHPSWCAPAHCSAEVAGTEHRAEPITLTIGAYEIAIGRTCYVETDLHGELVSHGERVTMTVIDRECVDDAGGEIRVDVDASEVDARFLAAAIGCIADQLRGASV